MNRYNGTIKRLVDFRGNVDAGKAKLKAKIAKADSQLNVKFNTAKNYITNIKNTTIFNGIVTRLNLTYRFVFAKSAIISKTEAKADTTPAVEIESDSAIRASEAAPIVKHPAAGISVDPKERVSVYAKLVAYSRAGCVYIKQLFFKQSAKLQAAWCAVAKYAEAAKLERTSKAISAESAIMESRYNKVNTGFNAAGSSATAQVVPTIENTFAATHKAQVGKVAVEGVSINTEFSVEHLARLGLSFRTEQDDATIHLFQMFSGLQRRNVLEIDTAETSIYWANANAENGVLNLAFAETATTVGTTLEVL